MEGSSRQLWTNFGNQVISAIKFFLIIFVEPLSMEAGLGLRHIQHSTFQTLVRGSFQRFVFCSKFNHVLDYIKLLKQKIGS